MLYRVSYSGNGYRLVVRLTIETAFEQLNVHSPGECTRGIWASNEESC